MICSYHQHDTIIYLLFLASNGNILRILDLMNILSDISEEYNHNVHSPLRFFGCFIFFFSHVFFYLFKLTIDHCALYFLTRSKACGINARNAFPSSTIMLIVTFKAHFCSSCSGSSVLSSCIASSVLSLCSA